MKSALDESRTSDIKQNGCMKLNVCVGWVDEGNEDIMVNAKPFLLHSEFTSAILFWYVFNNSYQMSDIFLNKCVIYMIHLHFSTHTHTHVHNHISSHTNSNFSLPLSHIHAHTYILSHTRCALPITVLSGGLSSFLESRNK